MFINRLVQSRCGRRFLRRGASPLGCRIVASDHVTGAVAMSRSFDNDSEEIEGPIDLDRLAIDSEYRRAVKLRLKTESEGPDGASRPIPAAFTASPRKD